MQLGALHPPCRRPGRVAVTAAADAESAAAENAAAAKVVLLDRVQGERMLEPFEGGHVKEGRLKHAQPRQRDHDPGESQPPRARCGGRPRAQQLLRAQDAATATATAANATNARVWAAAEPHF